MYNNGAYYRWSRTTLVLAVLTSSCFLKDEKIKARANGVVAGIGGAHGHFVAEAATICGEMAQAETSIVPPLDKECSLGCRCASGSGADEDPRTTYNCNQWDAREWQLIKFSGMYSLDGKVRSTVYVHHQARWYRTEQGCRLDFTVYGDLDEDGIYSTYSSWSEATPDGALGSLPDVSLLWE